MRELIMAAAFTLGQVLTYHLLLPAWVVLIRIGGG